MTAVLCACIWMVPEGRTDASRLNSPVAPTPGVALHRRVEGAVVRIGHGGGLEQVGAR